MVLTEASILGSVHVGTASGMTVGDFAILLLPKETTDIVNLGERLPPAVDFGRIDRLIDRPSVHCPVTVVDMATWQPPVPRRASSDSCVPSRYCGCVSG